jgi:membrane protein implicated in regulation of membrane protease activity
MNTFAGCFWIVVASAIVLFFPLQVIAFLLIIILAALIIAASTDPLVKAAEDLKRNMDEVVRRAAELDELD